MAQYEIFRAFFSAEEAYVYFELLQEKGLDVKLEPKGQVVDKIFGDSQTAGFHIKLQPEDFERADQVIDEQIRMHLQELDNEHFLFSFSPEELREVISKPDEWSNEDVIIAQKLLQDAGETMDDTTIAELRSTRIKELAQPDKEKSASLLLCYLSIFLVGGLFIGLFLATGKKLLPNGSKVFIYDKNTRDHGKIIAFLSAVLIVVAIFTHIIPVFIPQFVI